MPAVRTLVGGGSLLDMVNDNHVKRNVVDLLEFQAELLLERCKYAIFRRASRSLGRPAIAVKRCCARAAASFTTGP